MTTVTVTEATYTVAVTETAYTVYVVESLTDLGLFAALNFAFAANSMYLALI